MLNKIGAARGNLNDVQRAEYADSENVCQALAPIQMSVDKAALLADAKPLSSALPSLVKPVITNTAPKVDLKPQICSVADVTSRVNDWASAWRQKDADQYLKFYSDKFRPEPPLDKESWIKQRRERLSTNGKIGLKLNDLVVTCDGDKAAAKFNQDYTLTTFKIKKTADTACEVCNMQRIPVTSYRDKVNKELHFERMNGEWHIFKELVVQ